MRNCIFKVVTLSLWESDSTVLVKQIFWKFLILFLSIRFMQLELSGFLYYVRTFIIFFRLKLFQKFRDYYPSSKCLGHQSTGYFQQDVSLSCNCQLSQHLFLQKSSLSVFIWTIFFLPKKSYLEKDKVGFRQSAHLALIL